MTYALLTDEQIPQLEREGELDFSYSLMRIADFDAHVVYSTNYVESHFVVKPIGRD